MPVPQLPPEAFRFTHTELVHLTMYSPRKELGGLVINADEPVKATGWDPTVGEDGLVIPAGSMDALILHAPETRGIEQFQHSLALAGSYVALHSQLGERPYVVGITFEPLARFVVRVAGFSHIRPYGPDEEYQARVERAYGELRLSSRKPFKLAMVYMPTPAFIEAFANRRLGRSAEALLSVIVHDSDDDL